MDYVTVLGNPEDIKVFEFRFDFWKRASRAEAPVAEEFWPNSFGGIFCELYKEYFHKVLKGAYSIECYVFIA